MLQSMKISILALLLFAVVGCSVNSDTPLNIDELFKTTTKIELLPTKFKSDDIASPVVRTVTIGKYLFIQTLFSDRFIAIYDLSNQEKVGQLLSKGSGPLEMIDINSIHKIDNKMFVSGSQKVFLIDTSEIFKTQPYFQQKHTADYNYLTIMPICNERYIATGFIKDIKDAHFFLLDNQFNVKSIVDSFPSNAAIKALPDYDKVMGLQGNIITNKKQDKFVYASNFGSILKFFDLSEYKPIKVKEYLFEIPIFESRADASASIYGVVQSGTNVQGVIDLTAGADRCYMLYSGKKLAEGNRVSNVIYVFDFDGNPIEKIELDKAVEHIVFSEFDNTIIAFGSDEEKLPQIYTVKLNQK